MDKKTVTITFFLITFFCMFLANLFIMKQMIAIDMKQTQFISNNLELIKLLSENQMKLINK